MEGVVCGWRGHRLDEVGSCVRAESPAPPYASNENPGDFLQDCEGLTRSRTCLNAASMPLTPMHWHIEATSCVPGMSQPKRNRCESDAADEESLPTDPAAPPIVGSRSRFSNGSLH